MKLRIDNMIEVMQRTIKEMERIRDNDKSCNYEKALECAQIPANLIQNLRLDLLVAYSNRKENEGGN